ncbi:MAG: thiolase family protein [Flavobacteriales bacterium]
MKTAYIIKGYRSAVAKAPKGSLRFVHPNDLAAEVIKKLISELPESFDKSKIEDVIVGNAMPEAEQGLNIARLISLMGLEIDTVPGVTVNRFCASGSEAIAIATSKVVSGMVDCVLAGGVESMSAVPMTGNKPALDYTVAQSHSDYYFGMGLTAEEVAKRYNVSREEQDAFALKSHEKALKALETKRFKNQIAPIEVERTYLKGNKKVTETKVFDTDEGPRAGSTMETLAKLKPVFASSGSVTAANSSQMSDGAAFVLICSEEFVKEHNLKPEAKLLAYATAGLEPKIMGMGPVYAIPKALKKAGLELKDIDLIELNEAFASQSLAVIRELGIDESKVNVNGGAIALGHPLGCTGTKLTVQLLDEMRQRGNKYGMVTMCVGTGQGAASIFELV